MTAVVAARAGGAAAGVVLDRLVGEPAAPIHPVGLFGRLMEKVEHQIYADGRPAGATFTAGGVALGVAAGLALRSTAVAVGLSVAGRELGRTARLVEADLERGDLDAARDRLPNLVGRDVAGLGPDEVAAAVVESVAENTVDAVVAPVCWGLVAGAPGVLAHRAVNTLDAMVGHRSDRYERFGWASARLDDLANWVPARATALLVAAIRPRAARQVLAAVRRDAPAHPSPNAGVAEAAFAGALDVQLGGPLSYGGRSEDRPVLGDGRRPTAMDIGRAVRLSEGVTAACVGTLLGIALLSRRRAR